MVLLNCPRPLENGAIFRGQWCNHIIKQKERSQRGKHSITALIQSEIQSVCGMCSSGKEDSGGKRPGGRNQCCVLIVKSLKHNALTFFN